MLLFERHSKLFGYIYPFFFVGMIPLRSPKLTLQPQPCGRPYTGMLPQAVNRLVTQPVKLRIISNLDLLSNHQMPESPSASNAWPGRTEKGRGEG